MEEHLAPAKKTLQTERYLDQKQRWPKAGQHILAHYDEDSIVVYQAYNAAIGRYAVCEQKVWRLRGVFFHTNDLDKNKFLVDDV